ncbi:hypothetical protein L7F22_044333 [Adiantum nelumboides]|nr:hypothetical protein [Adiantum nelumboides]
MPCCNASCVAETGCYMQDSFLLTFLLVLNLHIWCSGSWCLNLAPLHQYSDNQTKEVAMGRLKQALQKYHDSVHDLFAAYGSYVAVHPLIPLCFGILLLGSLCVGIMRAEKESNIENLWVEQNSRVVPEKRSFESHFGGISRQQSVAISSKKYPQEKLKDLRVAMDALTSAIKPFYDKLVLNYSTDSHKSVELTQSDFCERPLIPQTLKGGVDPNTHGNWYAWGYRRVAKCALSFVEVFLGANLTAYHLSDDWGLDVLPCYKLSPMDCFQEGRDFDYPEGLRQLDQLEDGARTSGQQLRVPEHVLLDEGLAEAVERIWEAALASEEDVASQCAAGISELSRFIINATLNGTLAQLVAGFEQLSSHQCFTTFELELRQKPQSIGVTLDLSSEDVDDILSGVKTVINVFAGWGYNWRPSYKSMTSEQILDHFNSAIDFSKNTSLSLSNPAVQHCIIEKRPCCLTWFGSTAPVEAALGGSNYDTTGKISSIASIRWGANNWNQKHPLWMEYIANKLNTSFTDEQRVQLVLDWESSMVQAVAPLRSNAAGTHFSLGGLYQDLQLQFTMWVSYFAVLNLWQESMSLSHLRVALPKPQAPYHS